MEWLAIGTGVTGIVILWHGGWLTAHLQLTALLHWALAVLLGLGLFLIASLLADLRRDRVVKDSSTLSTKPLGLACRPLPGAQPRIVYHGPHVAPLCRGQG